MYRGDLDYAPVIVADTTMIPLYMPQYEAPMAMVPQDNYIGLMNLLSSTYKLTDLIRTSKNVDEYCNSKYKLKTVVRKCGPKGMSKCYSDDPNLAKQNSECKSELNYAIKWCGCYKDEWGAPVCPTSISGKHPFAGCPN